MKNMKIKTSACGNALLTSFKIVCICLLFVLFFFVCFAPPHFGPRKMTRPIFVKPILSLC